MARSRYKFFDTVYDEQFQHTRKGHKSINFQQTFTTSNDLLYTIEISEVYRPDILANKFYGDPTLYWVLVYANNISDSPEGFYEGRTIRVPSFERVIELV